MANAAQRHRRRSHTFASLVILLLVLSVSLSSVSARSQARSSDDDDEPPLKKGAKCSKSRREKIQLCLTDVAEQEAALPRGPCYSEDKRCYCIVQQGILDCWEKFGCEDAQPKSQVEWNNKNCKGVNKAAGGDYEFDLTKVKSYSDVPKSTSSLKDHKKHKHHSSIAENDDLELSPSPAMTARPTSTVSAFDYGYGSNSAPSLYGYSSVYVAPATTETGAASKSYRFTTLSTSTSIGFVLASMLCSLALGVAGVMMPWN
ncbi:hypothetical protein V8E36_004849 [Tilletia maclaganii]